MNTLKNILFKIYKIVFTITGFVLPKNEKMIIFESFLGKQYSDNPRAIYEYIREHYPTYKLYWSVDRQNQYKFKTLEVIYLKRFSLKWLWLMNRSKYWVSNSRLPLWIPKPHNTVYLQTWHGTPLKKLATDMNEVLMPGTNTAQYKANFVTETKKWDYLISPNAYSTEIFKRAFQFEKEVIQSGYPRNDYLINKNTTDEINKIKQKLHIPEDTKVILYAPTWRDNEYYGIGRYKFDIQMDLSQMQHELGDDYVIILRLHYLIAENIDISDYQGFVYNGSTHEDIRELYLISDILITDYSSVFFDYANLKRPMIFYAYDIDSYRDTLRGFYFDFEAEAPGPLVKTTEGLLNEIRKIEEGFEFDNPLKLFYEKYCYLEDGSATKRVVERLIH